MQKSKRTNDQNEKKLLWVATEIPRGKILDPENPFQLPMNEDGTVSFTTQLSVSFRDEYVSMCGLKHHLQIQKEAVYLLSTERPIHLFALAVSREIYDNVQNRENYPDAIKNADFGFEVRDRKHHAELRRYRFKLSPDQYEIAGVFEKGYDSRQIRGIYNPQCTSMSVIEQFRDQCHDETHNDSRVKSCITIAISAVRTPEEQTEFDAAKTARAKLQDRSVINQFNIERANRMRDTERQSVPRLGELCARSLNQYGIWDERVNKETLQKAELFSHTT